MQGFGWAIAKALAEAGAEISLGVWVNLITASAFDSHAFSTGRYAQDFSPQDESASVLVLQVPALNIFESSYRRGKFDASRKLSNGSLMEFAKVYPMDAVYDTPEEVPEDVSSLPCNADLNLLTPCPISVAMHLCRTDNDPAIECYRCNGCAA